MSINCNLFTSVLVCVYRTAIKLHFSVERLQSRRQAAVRRDTCRIQQGTRTTVAVIAVTFAIEAHKLTALLRIS